MMSEVYEIRDGKIEVTITKVEQISLAHLEASIESWTGEKKRLEGVVAAAQAELVKVNALLADKQKMREDALAAGLKANGEAAPAIEL